MADLYRFITNDGLVSVTAIDSTDIVREAEKIHMTSAVVTAALGRLLTVASLMGIALKGEKDNLTIRIKGDGEIDCLIACTDSKGNVKGYPGNPVVELPLNNNGKLDVGGAVGKGMLYVSKDLGLKEPYNGTVELVSGEIAEDIAAYFAVSEQIPTVCALGVLVNPDLTVNCAGGYLIQLLPAAGEDTIDKLEQSIKGMPSVTRMLSMGMTAPDIAKKVMNLFELELLDESHPEYKCDCSRERVERALMGLGKEELMKLADEQELTNADCHFCNKKYHFSPMQLRQLARKM